jgi:hypothetical protein
VLFRLLADPAIPLRQRLRDADLFMVRRTCKGAWSSLTHAAVTRDNAVRIALGDGGDDAHVPMLHWCLDIGATFQEGHAEAVGAIGDNGIATDLLAHGGPYDLLALLRGAVAAGRSETVQMLMAQMPPDSTSLLDTFDFRYAVVTGAQLDLAKQVDPNPAGWGFNLALRALSQGHAEFARWALADVAPADGRFVSAAAESGSLDLVSWLVEKGWPLGRDTMDKAAQSGNMDLVRWLAEKGAEPTRSALVRAARGGHTTVIDWLLQRPDQELTEHVMYAAAEYSTAETVDWLLARGCPHDPLKVTAAACANSRGASLFTWLLDERGFDCDPAACMARQPPFDAALLHRRFGTPLHGNYMTTAIADGDLDRFRYGLAAGAPVSGYAATRLVQKGDDALLLEFLRHGAVDGESSREVRATLADTLQYAGELDPRTLLLLDAHGVDRS